MSSALEAVREFNRFFTNHVGALDARFLGTDVNLPEARLLFEIARREPVLASELCEGLGFDRGYMSRLAARLETRGWLVRESLDSDARARPIRLTAAGIEAFRTIDQRQREAVTRDLDRLGEVEREDLVQSMAKVRLLLDAAATDAFSIRAARTGEVSQVAARQSVLYAASHGWGRELEALEAETVAAFLRDFAPDRERCWVADLAGVMAGAVFVTDDGAGVARLRLLHVEPFARRRGIGDALVRSCIGFAREAGYRQIVLWTHTVLDSARRIYARNGFELLSTEVHHEFGQPVQGETWRMTFEETPRCDSA